MITVKELLEAALGAFLVTAIGLGIFYIRLELERKKYIKEMEKERERILWRREKR